MVGQKKRGRWSCFSCVSKSAVRTKHDDDTQQEAYQHTYDPVKPAEKESQGSGSNRQAMLFVRMASSDCMSSSGGASNSECAGSNSSDTVDTADTAEEDVWYDCAEDEPDWFDSAAGQDSAQTSHTYPEAGQSASYPTAEQLKCLRILPPQLCSILTKYLQGNIGCKPLVALMHYMQDSKTSLSVLQALLQPLLDVEQHMPAQTAVPTPNLTPAERSEALRRQLHDLHPAGQSAHCTNNGSTQGACQQQPQQCQPRVGHLLHTLQLAERSLMLMDREEGFRQVASGPLSLWYCHDTEAKCQMLRARVVLEESVATIAAVAREFDLVPSWNPGMSDMRELASYSPTEVLVYVLPWMPWPFPLPEMVNFGFAADLLDLQQRCVLLHISSAEPPAGIELPKHARTLPIHMNVGGFRLVPVQPSPDKPDTPRTEVTVLVSIDAARFVIPDNIISCVLKVFAPLVYKSVLKVFTRMFHTAAAAAPAGRTGAGKDGPQRSSPSTCSSSLLLERLTLRPEYAALDAHASRVLASEAANGSVRPLELYTPRTTESGLTA